MGAWLAAAILAAIYATHGAAPATADPARFIGIRDFAGWSTRPGESPRQLLMASPKIDAPISWDELVISWNAAAPAGTGLKVEARPLYPDHSARWYTLGIWSGEPGLKAFDKAAAPLLHPRESVNGQEDEDGEVKTDTLVLKRPARALEVRITLEGSDKAMPTIRFLGLCLLESRAPVPQAPRPESRRAWGRVLDVPERAQGSYDHGAVICSPTCTSMALSYWAKAARRPDLERDVPEVVEGVYDRAYGGTGNWPFNTAYAASFPGMRGYVTRFTSLAELEQWIEAGIPVVCSVSWHLLRGRPITGVENGHLVVCAGFTRDGDVVVNDPGLNPKSGLRVRTTIPRKQFEAAWSYSRKTVYVIYPDSRRTPANRHHHWDG